MHLPNYYPGHKNNTNSSSNQDDETKIFNQFLMSGTDIHSVPFIDVNIIDQKLKNAEKLLYDMSIPIKYPNIEKTINEQYSTNKHEHCDTGGSNHYSEINVIGGSIQPNDSKCEEPCITVNLKNQDNVAENLDINIGNKSSARQITQEQTNTRRIPHTMSISGLGNEVVKQVSENKNRSNNSCSSSKSSCSSDCSCSTDCSIIRHSNSSKHSSSCSSSSPSSSSCSSSSSNSSSCSSNSSNSSSSSSSSGSSGSSSSSSSSGSSGSSSSSGSSGSSSSSDSSSSPSSSSRSSGSSSSPNSSSCSSSSPSSSSCSSSSSSSDSSSSSSTCSSPSSSSSSSHDRKIKRNRNRRK